MIDNTTRAKLEIRINKNDDRITWNKIDEDIRPDILFKLFIDCMSAETEDNLGI
jgi:hypothetical protein